MIKNTIEVSQDVYKCPVTPQKNAAAKRKVFFPSPKARRKDKKEDCKKGS